MTNEQILKKAIKKAVKNGWKRNDVEWIERMIFVGEYDAIIYKKDFAKAFWGEKQKMGFVPYEDKGRYTYEWEFHLQQMVISENPIKYLEKFIK